MSAEKGNQKELDVLMWSDGSVNAFYKEDFENKDKFIEYKLNKNPDLSFFVGRMTVEEYNNRL